MVDLSPSLLTNNKYRIFDSPFAYHLLNCRVSEYCSQCLRPPINDSKLLKCSSCQFVYYCNKECQKNHWIIHKIECRRLQKIFPNLPLTEVMFLSKVLDRVLYLSENGDQYGWEKERTFESLISHKDHILKDQMKMDHFEKIFNKITLFRDNEMVSRDKFLDVFCKVSINSHSIHSNSGIEIGMALDLGISRYNHSCRPTVSMVFDGIRVFFRPLIPHIPIDNLDKAFISYVDVGRSRYRRRKDLKAKWYFDCECERCLDPEENRLTSLKCCVEGCEGALITTEEEEAMSIACPDCGMITDKEIVEEGQKLMKELPPSFDPNCPIHIVEEYLSKAQSILHSQNVYVTRLQTALLHLKGELDSSLPQLHKTIYNNYKLCFPKADRHVAYSLLNIVKSLIKSGKRKEAVLYAYDAMTIFEVCLGLEHPFYLQTLALWTYLQNDSDKSDHELISLTKYGGNKPIDISSLLHYDQRQLTL